MLQSDVVNFSLTQTSCGGAYNNFFQIYIDYNQDGDFLDAGEQVYSQPAVVNGDHTITGSFQIPCGASIGTTRMRVVNIETNTASTTNYAHVLYNFGETEDYCITIGAGPGAPTVSCPADLTVAATSNCDATVSYNATASSGTLTYEFSGATSGSGSGTGSGSIFNLGVTTVTITSDDNGCVGSCSFTITVEDQTAPTLNVSADIAVNNDAGQCDAVVTFPAPTASDNCPTPTSSQAFLYTGPASCLLYTSDAADE